MKQFSNHFQTVRMLLTIDFDMADSMDIRYAQKCQLGQYRNFNI